MAGLGGQGSLGDGGQIGRNPRLRHGDRLEGAEPRRRELLLDGRSIPSRGTPRHDLVEDGAQRVHVRLGTRHLPPRLFGGHVGGRALHRAHLRGQRIHLVGHRRLGLHEVGLVEDAGQPPVDDDGLAEGPQHHVAGLEVAVHDAPLVGVGDRLTHRQDLREQPEPLVQTAAALEGLRERLAAHEAHRVEGRPRGIHVDIVHGNDVGMLQLGRHLDLPQEAGPGPRPLRAAQPLDRHLPPELPVPRRAHVGEAPTPHHGPLLVALAVHRADGGVACPRHRSVGVPRVGPRTGRRVRVPGVVRWSRHAAGYPALDGPVRTRGVRPWPGSASLADTSTLTGRTAPPRPWRPGVPGLRRRHGPLAEGPPPAPTGRRRRRAPRAGSDRRHRPPLLVQEARHPGRALGRQLPCRGEGHRTRPQLRRHRRGPRQGLDEAVGDARRHQPVHLGGLAGDRRLQGPRIQGPRERTGQEVHDLRQVGVLRGETRLAPHPEGPGARLHLPQRPHPRAEEEPVEGARTPHRVVAAEHGPMEGLALEQVASQGRIAQPIAEHAGLPQVRTDLRLAQEQEPVPRRPLAKGVDVDRRVVGGEVVVEQGRVALAEQPRRLQPDELPEGPLGLRGRPQRQQVPGVLHLGHGRGCEVQVATERVPHDLPHRPARERIPGHEGHPRGRQHPAHRRQQRVLHVGRDPGEQPMGDHHVEGTFRGRPQIGAAELEVIQAQGLGVGPPHVDLHLGGVQPHERGIRQPRRHGQDVPARTAPELEHPHRRGVAGGEAMPARHRKQAVGVRGPAGPRVVRKRVVGIHAGDATP